MMSSLSQLKKYSVTAIDTSDFELILKHQPTDATTNPSLILQASQKEEYKEIIDEAIRLGGGNLEDTMDILSVLFGCKILSIIPGRVSTEVDARLSFDTRASVKKAIKLISLYEKFGVRYDRVLIKLASTWEGVEAARTLEQKYGYFCNMTLLFNMTQAVACAEAGATLISPFVGRIYDYYKIQKYDNPFDDPGVQNVTKIYNYYKRHDYRTSVMGASFRNISEIKCLAGCDLLTISPALLEELENETGVEVPRVLSREKAKTLSLPVQSYNESRFRFSMNSDEMASFKLAEGIRKFVADQEKLESLVKSRMDAVR